MGRSIARPVPTLDSTTHNTQHTFIRASSGIRTHDPCVLAVQDYSRLRLRGTSYEILIYRKQQVTHCNHKKNFLL